jgi:hypothetical protein
MLTTALTSKKIDEVVRSVLDVTFRLDANELRRSADLEPQPLMVRANIAFNGAWQGQVVVYVAPELAKEMAAAMMNAEPGNVGRDETFDAIGEVANMIAGNLRPLIPGARLISVPKVTDQGIAPALPGNAVELSYRLDGRRLYVAVEGSSTASLN